MKTDDPDHRIRPGETAAQYGRRMARGGEVPPQGAWAGPPMSLEQRFMPHARTMGLVCYVPYIDAVVVAEAHAAAAVERAVAAERERLGSFAVLLATAVQERDGFRARRDELRRERNELQAKLHDLRQVERERDDAQLTPDQPPTHETQ